MSASPRERSIPEEKSLPRLVERHPDLWKVTSGEITARIAEALRAKRSWEASLQSYAKSLAQAAARAEGPDRHEFSVRATMARLALRQFGMAALLGKPEGRLRFGRWSGGILQRLLFESGLRRKAVSRTAWRLLWPLVTQKKILMPLVFPRGIYCFYDDGLLAELARLIGEGKGVVLEIAAGDGTLARLLRERRVSVIATDDYSWQKERTNPSHRFEEVEKLDAAAALRKYAPRVVLCSWPPAGNDFEKAVFRTESVERYVVIGSALSFATGDRIAYADAATKGFTTRRDGKLAKGVLPRELGNEVLVFERERPSA